MGRIRRTIMIGALASGATLATVGVADASVSPTASPHTRTAGDFGDFGGLLGEQPGHHKRDRETPRRYQDERRHHRDGRDYSVDSGNAREAARHQSHRHRYHHH